MTDQTIPADALRAILDGAGSAADKVQALHDMLPPPPLPTLAGMTDEERGKHVGGQVDVIAEAFGGRAILTGFETVTLMGMEFPRALILTRDSRTISVPTDEVTPRPDLPRLTWPGTEKPAPAPALPEGWRLADHREYGRVIVTHPTPGSSGGIYCVASSDWDSTGVDWHYCPHDELTYIDQGADQ